MNDFDKVLKQWGPVEADYKGIGNLVLTRLFIQYPELQKKFPSFDNIPPSELANNDEVSALGAIVLEKIAELLRAKGNHGEILRVMSERHANKHKVSIDNFKSITEILIKVMEEKAKLDKEGREALKRVMCVVINDIGANYQKLGFKG